ncbi:MAG TPA: hypothetical protein VL137_01825 [Polyangiaceae bacterium]|nr:hypothetical protein [Polyangiaceae bacterium]
MRCGYWLAGGILVALCGCKDDAPAPASATVPQAVPQAAPVSVASAEAPAVAQPATVPRAPEPSNPCAALDDHDLVAVIRCFYLPGAPLDLTDKWHWLTADEQKQSTEAEWKEKTKSDPTKSACVSAEVTMLGNPDLTLPGERLVSRHVRCPTADGKNKRDEVVTDTWVNEAGHWRWRQGK